MVMDGTVWFVAEVRSLKIQVDPTNDALDGGGISKGVSPAH